MQDEGTMMSIRPNRIPNIDTLCNSIKTFEQMGVSLTQQLQNLTKALIGWRITEIEVSVDAYNNGWNTINIDKYISQRTIDGERLLEGITTERKAHDRLIDLALDIPLISDDKNKSLIGLRPCVKIYFAKNSKSKYFYVAKPVNLYRKDNQTITVAYTIQKIPTPLEK